MGGIGKALFGSPGKQKSESSSGNHAWEPVSDAFKPALGYVTQGGNSIASLLGLGGDSAAQQTALSNFANSGGMKFLMGQGNNMINSNMAAKGALHSGATLKALDKYGQGLGSTYLNQYMDNLFKLSNVGLGAGGVMSQAGNWSKSKSSGSGGKQGIAGDIVGAIALSDARLKENIVYIGSTADGIPLVEYNYRQDTGMVLPKGRFLGVLAQDVAERRPEGIGREINGYLTVKGEDLYPRKI